MASELVETTVGELLSFANGRTSPERADGLPYPVYGSNEVIGYSNETNADEDTIVIGRVGSLCGSLYFSKHRCWVTDNLNGAFSSAAIQKMECVLRINSFQVFDLSSEREFKSGQDARLTHPIRAVE